VTVTDAVGCSVEAEDTVQEEREIPVPVITGVDEVDYNQEVLYTVPQIGGAVHIWHVDGKIIWRSVDQDSIRVIWNVPFDSTYIFVRTQIGNCSGERDTLVVRMHPGFVHSGDLFRKWFNAVQGYQSPGMAMAVMADQYTCSWTNAGMRDLSKEPREEFNNKEDYGLHYITDEYWENLYQIVYDAGRVIRHARELPDTPENKEMKYSMLAWGYFNLGLAHGYLGLVFDQAYLITPVTDTAKLSFTSYDKMVNYAITCLDSAINISNNHSFSLPAEFFRDKSVDNVLLAALANSYAARILVASPRNRQMNEQLPWSKVLQYVEHGLTNDFGITIDQRTWNNELLTYLNFPGWARIDHRIIHLMDPDYPARWPKDNVSWDTPDGEDPGEANSADARLNSDFEYLETNNYRPERGYYYFSHYRYKRYDNLLNNGGIWVLFSKAEADLIHAEALLHLGDTSEFLQQMNQGSRVSRGGLPALTGKESAREMWDALFYEREVELISSSMGLDYFDMRRRDMHQVGTLLHFPVPAGILKKRGITPYTYGGVFRADGWNTADGSNQWDQELYIEIKSSGCTASEQGGVIIHPLYGQPPYTYTIVGVGTQTDSLFTGLDMRDYLVTVTDDAGDTLTGKFSLHFMTVTGDVVNVCYGETNGEIKLHISGGTSPFEVHWSTGDSVTHLTDLAPGSYAVTVIDGEGCSDTLDFTVGENAEIPVPEIMGPTVVTAGDTILYYVNIDSVYSCRFKVYGADFWDYVNPDRKDSVRVVWKSAEGLEIGIVVSENEKCSVSKYERIRIKTHFEPARMGEWDDTCFNINVIKAEIDGGELQIGDELGVFDGDLCVGVYKINPNMWSSSFWVSIPVDNFNTPEQDGFTAGHPVTLRLWDTSEQREVTDIVVKVLSGDTIFAPGETLTCELYGTGNHFPVADAGKDTVIDEGMIAVLSAEKSFDPEGDTLRYFWTAPQGIALDDST